MVKGIDVVAILGDFTSCTTTLDEHAVKGFGVLGIAWTTEGDADDGDGLVHGCLCDESKLERTSGCMMTGSP